MYTDYKSIWIVKKTNSSFSPSFKEKVFLDYDAALAEGLEYQEKEIKKWEDRNKRSWDGSESLFYVLTLEDAFEEFGDKLREEAYDDSYSNGYRDGKDEGYDDGYGDGKTEGFNEGFEAGKAESSR